VRILRSALSSVLPLTFVALAGCGAQPAQEEPPRAEPEPAEAEPAEPPREPQPEPAEEPERPPPVVREPALVEPGAQLGAIRIGMAEAEVRALGLEESEADPRSRRFGPYQVYFDGGTVRRVEASFGDLGPVRIRDRTFEPTTSIYELRDAIGDCEWMEGGGERYRCASGALVLHTDHSLDPARYRFVVERR
jgi:hypothetical protein